MIYLKKDPINLTQIIILNKLPPIKLIKTNLIKIINQKILIFIKTYSVLILKIKIALLKMYHFYIIIV
jgi:hypothetical protein